MNTHMLPGQGDLLQREVDRQEREWLRSTSECELCEERLPKDEITDGLCSTCEQRLRPRCACGCGKLARIVADIRWPGGTDCRAPWVDVEHALESVSRHTPDRPSIDVIVDETSLPNVLSLAQISQSPCWCDMEAMSCFHEYEYHTRIHWCPQHGYKE